MAGTPKNDPTKDSQFQSVVKHFLSTPPKPHGAAKKAPRKAKPRKKPSK